MGSDGIEEPCVGWGAGSFQENRQLWGGMSAG